MKFAMGESTLGVLAKQTGSSSDELTTLVRALGAAAEPLEGSFRGAGRAAFDRFKAETDSIAMELGAALDAVLAGVTGQDRAFTAGESAMVDETRQAQAGAGFDTARFSGR
ncbi:MAG: hypothetical protein ACRCSP_09605 [Rhodoglobus sp.]